MKIFYGVQGTGNGHITRARVMAKALKTADIAVDFLFSGRPADQYFDMQIFNGYQIRSGLTFNTAKGNLSYLKTLRDTKGLTFLNEIRTLNLDNYDLIISDFEPVTAWAARKQKKAVLGIGHQYAFAHQIPKQGSDFFADQVMKYFAPANIGVGLHWHHFGQPILPPMIETPNLPKKSIKNKIVVYLPFEDSDEVIKLLAPFENFHFHLYSPQLAHSQFAHITCYPLSRDGFQQNVYDCDGIITNAGFELVSEALQLSKKILVKPLHSQMEQISNAAALAQLGYGHVMQDLDISIIEHWLHHHHAVHVTYPNTAKIIVDWIIAGMPTMDSDFIEEVWSQVNIEHFTEHQIFS